MEENYSKRLTEFVLQAGGRICEGDQQSQQRDEAIPRCRFPRRAPAAPAAPVLATYVSHDVSVNVGFLPATEETANVARREGRPSPLAAGAQLRRRGKAKPGAARARFDRIREGRRGCR
jgi:hypothetical protein